MDEFAEKTEYQNGLRPIDNRVLNNYFWSFHHSQGSPLIQTLISIHTARQYDKDEIGALDVFESRLLPIIERMRPPSEHLREQVDEQTGEIKVFTDKEFQENESGFQSQWGRLRMVFDRVFYDNPKPWHMNWMGGFEGDIYKTNELPTNILLYEILSRMVNSDLNYQEKLRPSRKGKSDPHSSHIQMYIFGNVPTQSPEYDQLYKDIRKMLVQQGVITDADIAEDKIPEPEGLSLKSRFEKLVQAWEKNHPGKKFIS